MWRILPLFLAASVFLAQDSARRISPSQGLGAGRRLALVIGNQNYERKPLRNSRADAESLDALLRSDLAFNDVLLLKDARLAEMQRGIRAFVRSVRPGDLALFYYSGHGMQAGGVNWMIPIDFHADFEDEVPDQAYSAQRLLRDLEDAGATVRIMILDACRDNPLPAAGRRSARDGLAEMKGAEGTYLLFATGENQTADDNPRGKNGLFTSYLLAALRQAGITLDAAFKETRRGVAEASGGKQRPWLATDIDRDLILKPATASPSAPGTTAGGMRVDAAAEAWELVKNSTNPEDFDDFAKNFPSGERAPVAKMRAAKLRRSSAAESAKTDSAAATSRGHEATAPSSSQSFLPLKILECESADCVPGQSSDPRHSPVWNFNGMQGDGHFGTGVQPLTIEHFDGKTIVVRRNDTTGPATGLMALYRGLIDGNRISGSITYWPGANTNRWNAVIERRSESQIPHTIRNMQALTPPSFPLKIRDCEGKQCESANAVFPAVWSFLNGTGGRGQFGTGDQPLTLVHLDGKVIVVRREDTVGPTRGLIAEYIGVIEGNRIEGSVTYWKDGPPRTGIWVGLIDGR